MVSNEVGKTPSITHLLQEGESSKNQAEELLWDWRGLWKGTLSYFSLFHYIQATLKGLFSSQKFFRGLYFSRTILKFGFRPGFGTKTALITFMDNLQPQERVMDRGRTSLFTLLDLSELY